MKLDFFLFINEIGTGLLDVTREQDSVGLGCGLSNGQKEIEMLKYSVAIALLCIALVVAAPQRRQHRPHRPFGGGGFGNQGYGNQGFGGFGGGPSFGGSCK